MKEKEYHAACNLPLYSYANPHLHGFCICLYIKGGCLYESKEENGLSHFFEHIVFKNINQKMNGQLYQTLDRLGLSFNACTYRELIQFTIIGSIHNFNKAAEIISYIFEPINVSENELHLELKRILAEIREEDEEKDLDFFMQKKIWKESPLSMSIPGQKKRLKSVTVNDLKTMQSKLLTSQNCFYYVTGAVTDEHMNQLIAYTDQFPMLKAENNIAIRDNVAVLPKAFQKRKRHIYKKKSDISEIGFAFDFTANHSQAERAVLYDLLFSGEYCRIFVELSEKTGLIYSYDSHIEEYKNAGSIYLGFEIAPSKMRQAAMLVTTVFNELKKGQNICLDYVLPAYVANSDLQLDDISDLNWTFAYEKYFLGESWTTLKERSNQYAAVTPARIQAISRDIFRPENLTLSYKGPKGDCPKKLMDEVFNALSTDL